MPVPSPRRSPSGSRSGTNIPAASKPSPPSRSAPASRASSTSCISRTASWSRPAIRCSPSTSGPTRSPSKSAKADVARNKAQVELAELQVGRGAALVDSRNITEAENDTRKSNLAVAKAQLKAAEAALRNAQLNLEWTEVTRADRRPHLRPQGRCRQPDPGRPERRHPARHHRHARSDPFRVRRLGGRSSALQRLFLSGARPQAGSSTIPVRIRLADETEWTRTGKVDFVDNTLSPRSGTIRTRAVVENKDHLLTPGVFGRVQLYRRRVRRAADPRFGRSSPTRRARSCSWSATTMSCRPGR